MIRKIIAIVVVFIIMIVGITIYLSPDDLSSCQTPSTDGKCRVADAIVVISGGDTSARTAEAIQLYKKGWAPYIIVSGAAADKSGPSNAEAMREQAVSSGVPDSAIFVEGHSETTKQNALEVATIIEQNDIQDIILVTSGYHMRRASLEFSASVSGVTVRSHPVSSDKHWSKLWWMTPWGWWISGSELVKIMVFYIGGSR